jgi:hypothetical protein
MVPRTNPALVTEQPQPVEEVAEPILTEQRQRIGPAIRQLRQQQGCSLSDLAQRTGISVQDARQVDEQLVDELSHTPIPKLVWPEVLGMSLEGRKALAAYLEQQEAPA